jgi:hypothetical protein
LVDGEQRCRHCGHLFPTTEDNVGWPVGEPIEQEILHNGEMWHRVRDGMSSFAPCTPRP